MASLQPYIPLRRGRGPRSEHNATGTASIGDQQVDVLPHIICVSIWISIAVVLYTYCNDSHHAIPPYCLLLLLLHRCNATRPLQVFTRSKHDATAELEVSRALLNWIAQSTQIRTVQKNAPFALGLMPDLDRPRKKTQ